MADDDQATLGSFAEGEASGDGSAGVDRSSDGGGSPDTDRATGIDGRLDDDYSAGDGPEPVCPWCLAPATAFVDAGLTGRACGRCSAVLPVGADWFRDRDVVARRPSYDRSGSG
jgi:hypothetical protein